MPSYTFRLATPGDLADIRRLQVQFMTEMQDPLDLTEEIYQNTEFVLLEAADARGARVVGIMGVMRASASPFVFEQVFPDVWDRVDRRFFRGLRREEMVEGDWGYVEKEHRRRHLALALWAGLMLLTWVRGYPVMVGMANPTTIPAMGDAFHLVGLATNLGGLRYELGVLFPAEIAPRMIDIARQACARDPDITWRLPGLEG
jgi:hypothetical protein